MQLLKISVQLLPQQVCNLKIIAHFSIGKTVYKINKYMISNLITEIILMNVHNMTTLAKVSNVKLNKKVSIYMEGMWSTKILTNSCVFAYE